MDLPELETPAATAFEFPANDGEASSPLSAKLPRRLRRRLSAETKAPSTAEEIDAKLREASLRRQVGINFFGCFVCCVSFSTYICSIVC